MLAPQTCLDYQVLQRRQVNFGNTYADSLFVTHHRISLPIGAILSDYGFGQCVTRRTVVDLP